MDSQGALLSTRHRIAAIETSSIQTGPYTDGINLDHVLYVPTLKRNLLSVGSLAD